MRTSLYIIGSLLSIFGILCLMAALGTNNTELISYGIMAFFFTGGSSITLAAIKDYKGGMAFLAGACVLSLCNFFAFIIYADYLKQNTANVQTGLIVTALCLVLGLVLIYIGHRTHTRKQNLLADEKILATNYQIDNAINANVTSYSEPSGVDTSPVLLYPPVPLWRTFLLLVTSSLLYSIFLTYRTVTDLVTLGEKQYKPRSAAISMLVPLYGLIVFMQISKSQAKLAKQHNRVLKFKPSLLICLFIITGLSSIFLPSFLYPLTISLATLPWLLLHQQMNTLRFAHGGEWRVPPNRFSWGHRSLISLGLVFMGIILYGLRADFQYFSADRLANQQLIPATLII